MTEVTFEVAAFADAINKASRIAPTRGSAFDKASGIVIEVRPTLLEHSVTVKATDTDITYLEWVDSLAIEGNDATWRLPSGILQAITSRLPIGSNKTVTMQDHPTKSGVLISCGRIKAEMRTIPIEYFPNWNPFDPSALVKVTNLSARLAQVAWATGNGDPPLTGVHMDGEKMVGTDRYKMVIVDCQVPLGAPITVPFGNIEPVLKNITDAHMLALADRLLLMPDATTQIQAVIFQQKFPNVQGAIERNAPWPHSISIEKTRFLDCIQRMSSLVKSDRFPLLTMKIGREEITCSMTAPELADIEEVLEVDGQALHEVGTLLFTPDMLEGVLSHSPSEKVDFWYCPESPKKLVKVDGGSGFVGCVMPRVPPSSPAA